jgi:hypothetical protein
MGLIEISNTYGVLLIAIGNILVLVENDKMKAFY